LPCETRCGWLFAPNSTSSLPSECEKGNDNFSKLTPYRSAEEEASESLSRLRVSSLARSAGPLPLIGSAELLTLIAAPQ
jgi:hypothetical protein